MKPVKFRFKIDLVLHPAHGEGLGKYIYSAISSLAHRPQINFSTYCY